MMKKRGYYSYYPPYVSVAEKKERNARMTAKLKQAGRSLHPIVLTGRTIASTFWGKAWCKNVESYQDFSNRLPRGRTYIRAGAVLDLQIAAGKVTALVAGSQREPYQIDIDIAPLPSGKWEVLKRKCVGKISSLLALIQGKLPPEILEEFCDLKTGLFPSPDEIKMRCSCPDYAYLCKHLAAVLYGIGARLDEDPTLFFTLRKIDSSELLTANAADALTAGVEEEISADNLESMFGVSFDGLPEPAPATVAKTTRKKAESPKPAREKAPSRQATVKKTAPKATKWTGEKLARMRQKLDLSRAEVASLVGVTPQTIYNWEKGKFDIREIYFPKLEQCLKKR